MSKKGSASDIQPGRWAPLLIGCAVLLRHSQVGMVRSHASLSGAFLLLRQASTGAKQKKEAYDVEGFFRA